MRQKEDRTDHDDGSCKAKRSADGHDKKGKER
jgi:hypothetical protein